MKKELTAGKKSAIIVSVILVAIAIATAFIIIFMNKPKDPVSIMTCKIDANPTQISETAYSSSNNKASQFETQPNGNLEMNFVLDKKNKVISVHFASKDADMIFQSINFKNKTAEDCAKLFVEIATKAGYVQLDLNLTGTGTKVDVNISTKANIDLDYLQNRIENKINNFFDENGIVGGAIVKIDNALIEALRSLDGTIENIADKTEDELLKEYALTVSRLENIAYEKQNQIITKINTLRNDLKLAGEEGIYATINSLEKVIDSTSEKINSPESHLNQIEKDRLNELLKSYKTQLKTLKQNLKIAEQELNTRLDSFLKEKIEESKEIYTNLKIEYNKKVDETKTKLAEHKQKYSENKEEINQRIIDFRNHLKNIA